MKPPGTPESEPPPDASVWRERRLGLGATGARSVGSGIQQRGATLRIVGIYALFGCLWIYLSDTILGWLIRDPDIMVRVAVFKGTAFILLTASLLYVLVKRQLDQYHLAEEALRRLVEFDGLINRLLTRFASANGPEIDDHIQAGLRELALFMGVDSASIYQTSPDHATWSITHYWRAGHVPPLPENQRKTPMGALVWIEKKLAAGEVVPISTLNDLPRELDSLRQRYKADGVKSVLFVPLRGRGDVIKGSVGLHTYSREITWVDEDIRRLRMATDALANALERAQAEGTRANLEAQLRQVQKMEAFGQLAGGVAHDFNNILTVIQSHASLLQLEDQSREEREESVREIVLAADRASNLTRQLLTFSRRGMIQPAHIDLNAVVANIAKMLQRLIGENIRLETRFAPGAAAVYADPGMLEQVLMNLAVNARDAMPKGGRLIIQTGAVQRGEPFPEGAGLPPGQYVQLSVTDTGCGIASEHLPRIFEPFFTTKEVGKGTGLGLATVFGIVDQHKGKIEVESKVGCGTTFHIYLPQQSEAATSIEPPPAPEARAGHETILLVEDEAAVRALARQILIRKGYRVHEAGNGPEAIEVWRQHRDRIDLLLTDLIMPEGMTGRELAERLLAERPDLRVVYCSGYSEDMLDKNSSREKGFHFLQKPYDPNRLARIVRDCLDRNRPNPSHSAV